MFLFLVVSTIAAASPAEAVPVMARTQINGYVCPKDFYRITCRVYEDKVAVTHITGATHFTTRYEVPIRLDGALQDLLAEAKAGPVTTQPDAHDLPRDIWQAWPKGAALDDAIDLGTRADGKKTVNEADGTWALRDILAAFCPDVTPHRRACQPGE